MKGRHDPARHIIKANFHLSLLKWIFWIQRNLIRIRFIQVLAYKTALDQQSQVSGLAFVAFALDAEGGHKAAWVDFQIVILVVRVDFSVSIGEFLFLENDPCALYEGAEPPGIEGEVGGIVLFVLFDDVGGVAGGVGEDVGVGYTHN